MDTSWEIIERPFVFQRRPRDLPGDLRVAWRVSLVLLILAKCSHGRKATLQKLHALNWICYSNENRNRFIAITEGRSQPDDLLIRIEPSLNRAIDFAVGETLFKWVNGNRLQLTELGEKFIQIIIGKRDCMLVEVQFINQIKSFLTETYLENLFSWKRNVN